MSFGSFDMNMYNCRRCSKPWSSNAIESAFISKVCPDCIPLVLPEIGWGMLR